MQLVTQRLLDLKVRAGCDAGIATAVNLLTSTITIINMPVQFAIPCCGKG